MKREKYTPPPVPPALVIALKIALSITALLALILVFNIVFYKPEVKLPPAVAKPAPRTDPDGLKFAAMEKLQVEYTALHDHAESWFVTNIPKGEFVPKAADVVWKKGEWFRNILAAKSGVSKETEEIWNNFKEFGTSLQIGAVATIAMGADKERFLQGKEMAFLPKELAAAYERQTGKLSILLCWRPDMGLSIAAIDWPEKFVVGAVYHEMFHGLRHPVSAGLKGFFKPDSIEYAVEEMEAHRIESLVLNSVTNGEYFKKFDEIVTRAGPDPKNVLAAITIDDLKFFDSILGMENVGTVPAGAAVAQHSYGLASYQLEKLGRPKLEWGQFFQWLTAGGITSL